MGPCPSRGSRDFPERPCFERSRSIFYSGGVGIIPTDTIYAIVCDVENRSAVEKLYKVRARREDSARR